MLSRKFTVILIIFLLQISLFLFWKPTSIFAACSSDTNTSCSSNDECELGSGSPGDSSLGVGPSPEEGCTGYFCDNKVCKPPGAPRTSAPTTDTTTTCSMATLRCSNDNDCLANAVPETGFDADCSRYECRDRSCQLRIRTRPAIPPGPGGAGVGCFYNISTLGIMTAIGCVPTEPSKFILAVSRLLSGMGGGIALLLMISGTFRMITSGGNPDGVKAGSEQLTSALIGLLFIIFAVLLLKVIGVDILDLPGFGP